MSSSNVQPVVSFVSSLLGNQYDRFYVFEPLAGGNHVKYFPNLLGDITRGLSGARAIVFRVSFAWLLIFFAWMVA